jgi:MerR family transcriptional regulator/heat shock protein HspR
MRDERKNRRHHNDGQVPNDGRHGRAMPVYHISIVAEMVETHPQTLRMYERMGLINPQRTRNNIRLYSDEDVELVRRIQHLTQELGVNLAGVEVVFKLLGEIERMRAHFESQLEMHGLLDEDDEHNDGAPKQNGNSHDASAHNASPRNPRTDYRA